MKCAVTPLNPILGQYSEDDTGYPLFLALCHLQECGEVFCRTLIQLPQQLAIEEENLAKNLGYTKNVLPMGNGKKHRFFQVMGKLNHLLL